MSENVKTDVEMNVQEEDLKETPVTEENTPDNEAPVQEEEKKEGKVQEQ